MADYSKTFTMSLNIWGPEQTEKWSSATVGSFRMIWGTDNWAYGTGGLEQLVTKGIDAGSFSLLGRSELNVGKWVSGSFTPSSTIGLAVGKNLSNAQAITTTVGKLASVFTTNSAGITTTVGNDLQKFYDNTFSLTDIFENNLSGIRTMTAGPIFTTTIEAYLSRQSYTIEVGGISNAVNWPRSTAFSRVAANSTTWTDATATSTVWV